ncbi:MAG: hypothetical protein ACJ0E3_00775 [Gammaproteobacteria bacterium]
MDIEKNKKILLIGASGLVGGLIAKFCEENKYHQVQINRTSLCKNSDLIEEIVTDYNDNEYLEDIPSTDHVCIASGSRLSLSQLIHIRKKDRELFRNIDLKMPVEIAKSAFLKGAKEISIISAVGADENSMNYYLKIKGILEKEIKNIGFEKITFVRPGHLLGKRNSKVAWEVKFYEFIFMMMKPLMIGVFKKFRNVQAEDVALAVVSSIEKNFDGSKILEYDDIVKK